MIISQDDVTGVINIRQTPADAPQLAVEELKKERAKRETLESQMAAVMAKLGIKEV